MKKLTKLLSVFVIAGALCAGVAGTAGCTEHTPKHNYTYTDNNDGTHDGVCTDDGCDKVIDNEPHIWGADKKCTKCEHARVITDPNADDISATPIVATTFEDETGTAANVPDPNLPAYAGKDAALESGEVNAEIIFDPADLSTVEYTDGWTDGVFALAKKTTVRGRIKTGLYEGAECVDPEYVSVNSVKLGDNNSALEITVPAAGTLVFYVQNGSSGTTGTQSLTLTKPDGTETISYAADGSASTVQRITKQLTQAGKYTTKPASGTSDIFYAKYTATLQQSSVESIRVANTGKTDYLVGQQLDCSAVAVVRKHATGATIPVSSENIQIDTSAYNPAVPGTYEIKVKYGIEGNLGSDVTEFETSYNVNVYDYEDLDVSVEHVTLGKVSSAGNSAYVNNAFRQFYLTGETFSTDGISLIVTGKLGESTKTFKLDASAATVTGADLTTPGVQTVKIAYTANGKTKAKGVLITVVEKPASVASESEVKVAINKNFAQANIGTKNADGAYRFNTIQQALEFLEACELNEDTPKTMYLAEGTYWEKVEVNVPNLTIIGAGADKTKIEYDALYGVEDAGGFTHVTDSTATLNVRDKAEGFIIKGVAISNYYNTAASYEGALSNDCRALAMLIQADKVVVDDCTLLGYQDTLELFTGRQLFKNCVIKGVTDYIFGTNNTTYFYKCEIRNINHAKSGQAGYVTAFKGNNKGSSVDKVTYGAIFDDCDFTADSGVPTTCAMGRAWGPDAAVMIMNSRIGGHIAKTGSTSAGGRYISMGNGDPKNAQFTEYNNTGAGAITSNLDTVKVLTEEQAKNYNDFAVIFGKVNNLLSYSDVWNVTKD
ncbi:MAG: bacterial Ig-like domain-containing protein [Clostridia bacterium]|nr:bacterial Ig-like domain-containing protein [Clostridia bacterium]